MVDDARKTPVGPRVVASVSEGSFVDNSYSNDSSDSGVRDILDIKHIHKRKTNALSPQRQKPLVLGTVVKAEDQNEYSGDSFSTKHADSIYCSEQGDDHKQRKKKSRKKKSKQSTKPDVLSDVEKMDILDSAVSVSSHKHKRKKRSRKSVPLSDVEETDVLDGDNLKCSALEDSHQHNRTTKSRFPKPDTLSDVTGWVMEAGSLDYNDPLSLDETVNYRKSKKKKRKLTKSDTLSTGEEADVLDHDTSIDSHKHRKKSRKFVQSDMVPDVEEASVHGSVVVDSHEQKEAKKLDTFFQSGNLSDVADWVLTSDISSNDSPLDPVMSSQKGKKGSKRLAQSDGLLDLQSVPDSVSSSKRKRKSRKMQTSDNLPDATNLVLESDSQNYNDMRPLVDSEKSHKGKKKSSTFTQSDILSSIEETNVLDRDTPVGSHKHKRTKKNKKCAESETLSGVEATSSVDDIAMMNSQKQQEAQALDTFFQSGIFSDVPDLEPDFESITSNISQLMCLPDSLNTQSLSDSVTSAKCKKKPRKTQIKSDTLSSGTNLAQEADILDYSTSQSMNDSVNSPKSKKKSRKLTKSDTLSSGTNLAQEADILDYSTSQSMNDSVNSPKSKKKSRKLTKSDTLSSGTNLAQEADILDYSTSQSMNDSVNSPKSKKKSRKLTKSDTLSSGTNLAQEADILDYSTSQSMNDSVNSPKSKKKSRKGTNSSTFSDDFLAEFAQIAENLDYNDSQSLISPKSKEKQTKLAQSEPLLSVKEKYFSGLQLLRTPAVVSQHKGKTKKRSSKSPGSDDLSAGSHVPDKLNILSPTNKKRPVKRKQPEPSEVHEDHNASSQSQLFVSLDFQTPNKKRRSKSKGKLDVKTEPGEEQEQEEEPQSARPTGNESMLSYDDIFRNYRCVPTPPAADNALELMEMLTDVIDDDEKFADVLHAYEKNISATRCRKTKKILQAQSELHFFCTHSSCCFVPQT